MKNKGSVVPEKIEDVNAYQIVAAPYLKLNETRLTINPADIATLNLIISDPVNGWTFLHAQHSNPLTKTEPGNKDLLKCKKALTKQFQYIFRNIPRNVMITADFVTLNIAEPDFNKSRRSAITNSPFAKIIALAGAILKFIVRTDTDAKRASMEPLADVIRVMGIILKPGDALPTDPSECNITFTSTKAIFKHNFSIADAGNRFACFVQYVNTTDESKNGPVSAMLVCVIGM